MSRDDVLFRAWRNKDASGVDVGRNSTREIYFRLDIGVCTGVVVVVVVCMWWMQPVEREGREFFRNFIDPSSIFES